MEVIIHKTIKRPWGNETPYTAVVSEDEVYNGFIPRSKITKQDIIDHVQWLQSLKKKADSLEVLKERKTELEAELNAITEQINKEEKKQWLP